MTASLCKQTKAVSIGTSGRPHAPTSADNMGSLLGQQPEAMVQLLHFV
jgi:predicted urease superfamily metal-dependent hydrolase